MNNSNFEILFPLLNYENSDEYEDDCRFFFPEDPTQCINYVNTCKQEWYNENDFALKQCLQDKNLSIENCKKYAKTNDTAFNICKSHIPQSSPPIIYYYIIIGFLILFIIVIFVVIKKSHAYTI
jgi:hypothetical protein